MNFFRFMFVCGCLSVPFGCVVASCVDAGTLRPERPTAELSAHQRACQAKGEVIIEKDLMFGEPCQATDLRLRALVATDEDCLAYFGDAGAASALCPPAPKDGGAG